MPNETDTMDRIGQQKENPEMLRSSIVLGADYLGTTIHSTREPKVWCWDHFSPAFKDQSQLKKPVDPAERGKKKGKKDIRLYGYPQTGVWGQLVCV